MEESIKIVKQKNLKAFQRTQEENDGLRYKADVCIICDCFIIGNDSIRYLHEKVIKTYALYWQGIWPVVLQDNIEKWAGKIISRFWFARTLVVSKVT